MPGFISKRASKRFFEQFGMRAGFPSTILDVHLVTGGFDFPFRLFSFLFRQKPRGQLRKSYDTPSKKHYLFSFGDSPDFTSLHFTPFSGWIVRYIRTTNLYDCMISRWDTSFVSWADIYASGCYHGRQFFLHISRHLFGWDGLSGRREWWA